MIELKGVLVVQSQEGPYVIELKGVLVVQSPTKTPK